MKVKTKKIMAVICLILTFFTALPLQTFAAFITDMNSNAEFGVIDGSLATYNHELHYANYDGATYMLFCIEYGKKSPTGRAYVYGDEFLAQYKENKQEYKKIAEMIYFGYTMKHGMGLPGSYEAQRDACATQQYVWEEIGNAPSRDSWNGSYMSSEIYANWLAETETNYNQYHSRVSFDGESRAVSVGETTTFSDGNGTLAHFDAFNTTISGVNFAHDNGSNELRVTATSEANGTITFNSREHGVCELMPNGSTYSSGTMSNYVYFQFNSGSVQNLMFSSYVDPTVFNVSVEIQSGNLQVKKINSYGNPVANCNFDLYSNETCTNKVGSSTSNGDGLLLFENLKPGTYWVKETSVPNGYLLDTTIKRVEVVSGQTATVEFKNNEPTGKLLVYKVSDNNDKVGGALFSVKATEDIKNIAETKTFYTKGQEVAQITSDNTTGIATLDNLPLGNYSVQEIKAPSGYLLNDKVYSAKLEYKNATTPVVEIKIEGVKNTEPTGKIIIYKESEYGDKLTDAIFSVKADEEITNKAGSKTFYHKGQEVAKITTQNGVAQIENLPLGKYTIQEVQAPNGYLLNDKVYTAKLEYKDDKTPVIEIKIEGIIDNEPRGSIGIVKTDSKTGSVAQGDATLENAVYKIYANEDIYNVAKSKKFYSKGDLVATRNTDKDGNTTDVTGLPLGTYIVKEETAPKGYLLDTTVYEVKLEYKDQYEKVISGRANSKDKVKEMGVHIFKSGIKVNSGKTPGLAGAEFTIKLNSAVERAYENGYSYAEVWNGIDEYGNKVEVDENRVAKAQEIAPTYETIVTNESGDAYTQNKLPYGTYIVKETFTPIDYETASDFTFSITDDETEIQDVAQKVKHIVVNNEQQETYIKLVKKDLKTGKIVTLTNATFQIKATKDIYDRATGKILYKKGEAVSQKVGSTTFTSFTTNADNLVVPDKSYTNDKEDKGTIITPLKLEVGSYEVTEIKIPEGFLQLDNSVKFDVKGIRNYDKDQDGDFIKEIVIKNEQPTATIIIDKSVALREGVDTSIVDISDLSPIQFKLTAKDNVIDKADGSVIYKKGQEIGTYNVDKKGNLKIEELPMGVYELQEIKTLDGLVLNNEKYEFKFEKKDDTTKVYTQERDVINDTTLVEISKQDITGDKELEGAKLTVLDGDKVIDTWTSTDKTHKIEGLKVGTEYTLKEEIAPDGYVRATDIKFKVENTKENQKVKMIDKIVTITKEDIGGKEIEGVILQVLDKDNNVIDEWTSGKEVHKVKGLKEGETYKLHEEVCVNEYVKATDVEFKVTTDKETQHEKMIDKIVEITKTDLVTGDEIEGAELEVIDENGNIVDKWTSSKEPHKVTGLEEGKTYKLVEKTAPYGYEIAEEIEFTVSFDKETQKCEMKDMPILKDIQLIKVDSKTKETIKLDFTFGIYEDEACTKLIKEVHSDKENGTILFEDLRYGTYYIKEIQAPNDYMKSDKVVKVEINDSGVFVNENSLEENEDGVYAFEFENEKIETPNTGDNSDIGLWLTLLAVSSIAIAGIGVNEYKKRKSLKK